MPSKLRAEERVIQINQSPRQIPRVLIADRDSMSSDLLAGALARDGRCEAAAIQPSELLATLAASDFDVVVIAAELEVNTGNAFDLVATVCRTHNTTGVVMLLSHFSHEQVIKAFRLGARGVFSRQQPMAEFLSCVEHVRKGFIWAGKQETTALLEAFRSIPAPEVLTPANSPSLTVRELQVVKCAARGKTNKSIAAELGLSEHTVKNYLFRAFEKLGVSSRVELLFYLTVSGHSFSSLSTTKTDGPEVDGAEMDGAEVDGADVAPSTV
ncbi:MAG: response regulator transcription factor [Acidobacteriota bacterium]|nr:response regulator transcription factor [Acidobacteriota bacterium]